MATSRRMSSRPLSPKNLSSRKYQLIDRLKLDNGVDEILLKLIIFSERDINLPTGKKHKEKEYDLTNSYVNLDTKTEGGDTLLHRIVYAINDHPEDLDLYVQLVDIMTEYSELWWKCKTENKSEGVNKSVNLRNGSESRRYHAMNFLLGNVTDEMGRTVWQLTFQLVSVAMIEKLVFLEGVTCFKKGQGKIHFVVEQFTTPEDVSVGNIISDVCAFYCCMHQPGGDFGTLLQRAKSQDVVVEILRIKPIYKIAEMYSSVSTKVYFMIVILHMLYMSIFSYAGCDLVDSTKSQTSNSTKGLLYTIGLFEPVLLCFYLITDVLRCLGVLMSGEVNNSTYKKHFAIRFLTVLVYTTLLCQTISKVDKEIYPVGRNVLSLTLLLGWLLTLAIANGIESIHFFFSLVIEVMATDVLKILIVYMIFLTGFSFSLHAQFVSSSNITSTYKTPFHTMFLMFNVMMGIEEAVSDNTEAYLEAANAPPLFSKILYITYILCCSIVLLNLLIALMNSSYSRVRHQHSYDWLCQAAHFGNKLTNYFPFLARCLGAKYVKYGSVLDDQTKSTWYIVIDENSLEEKDNLMKSSNTDIDLQKVDDRIQNSAKRLRNEIHSAKNEIMEYIKDLKKQMSNPKMQSSMERTKGGISNPNPTGI